MTADLPPIPQCVVNIADVKTQSIVIDGKNEDVRSFLDDQVKKGVFEISLSRRQCSRDFTIRHKYALSGTWRLDLRRANGWAEYWWVDLSVAALQARG